MRRNAERLVADLRAARERHAHIVDPVARLDAMLADARVVAVTCPKCRGGGCATCARFGWVFAGSEALS